MKVIVLSDTHAPRRWRSCPPAVAEWLRGADLILHAGDACTAGVLDQLAAYAPVRAVRGNNDGPDVAIWGAPDTLELDLDGLRVAMIHDAGPARDARPGCANDDGPDVAAWGAPDTLELDLGGFPVAMIHDAGPARGRPARMRRRFPGAQLVVFGHSHIPLDCTTRTGSGSSIPARPPTAAASRRAPSGSWISGMASSLPRGSSRSPRRRDGPLRPARARGPRARGAGTGTAGAPGRGCWPPG